MRRPSLTFIVFVTAIFLVCLINQCWMIFTGAWKHIFAGIDRFINVRENFNIQNNKRAESSINDYGRIMVKSTEKKMWNVLMSLTNLDQHQEISKKFMICLTSICKHTDLELQLHIVTDERSKSKVTEVIEKLMGNVCKDKIIVVSYHNISQVAGVMLPYMKVLETIFTSGSHSYYSGALFFLSIVTHILFPHISKLIVLDADLKFRTDIKQLFFEFEKFSPTNVLGIAHEQQPVYRHITWEYRRHNPRTKIGEPPPEGHPGFNSGVLLLDLHRMRNSPQYHQYIENISLVKKLGEKYHFRGHLGDQGFYTLLSFEHPDLFHVLPCSWNRQLCVWWRNHGYKDIFDLYHNCTGHVHVYHGNCNTPIPDNPP